MCAPRDDVECRGVRPHAPRIRHRGEDRPSLDDSSERRKGDAMSRWLWALLGGRRPRRDRSRLLVSQQPDERHTLCFARSSACRSRAGSARAVCSCAGRREARSSPPAPARSKPRPSPPPSPAPPAAQEAATPRSRSDPGSRSARRPLPLRRLMRGSKLLRRPLPRRLPRNPSLRPLSRRSPRLRLLLPPLSPKRLCRRPRPEARSRKPKATTRPRASHSWSGHGPIPLTIATSFSSGAAAAGPSVSPWTSSPRL